MPKTKRQIKNGRSAPFFHMKKVGGLEGDSGQILCDFFDAVIRSDDKTVTSLLKICPEVIFSRNRNTLKNPLFVAADFNRIEMVKLLLVMGADPNGVEISGLTVSHIASAHGYIEVVKLLIAYGANLNAMDQNFNTPLHLAVKNERAAMVDLLMMSGANSKLHNSYGCTPYELKEAIHPEIRKVLLRQVELISAIVDANIAQVKKLLNIYNVNSRISENLWTPLHFATLFSDLVVIELLLKFGADVNAMDCKKMTPIDLAIEIGNVDVVFLLLKNVKTH